MRGETHPLGLGPAPEKGSLLGEREADKAVRSTAEALGKAKRREKYAALNALLAAHEEQREEVRPGIYRHRCSCGRPLATGGHDAHLDDVFRAAGYGRPKFL